MPEQFAIRPEGPGDELRIRAVVGAAFGQPDEADLVDALRAAGVAPFISLVAVGKDDSLLGHVLFTPVRPEAGPPLLALAPLAVTPGAQRRGIGAALVRAGLAAARAAGAAGVVVVGDPEYYGRFSFRPASAWGLRAPWALPEACVMALALDKARMAPCRGLLEYAAPFHAL